MILRIEVCRVETSLLYGSLNSLLNHLLFGLLYSNLKLLLYNLFRAVILCEGYRIHSGNLHCNLLTYVSICHWLVETNDCAHLVVNVDI